MHIDEEKVMVVHRGKMADGSVSYTEQDGDVGYNELPDGKWEMHSTNFPDETKTFDSYRELEDFMWDYLELEGIIVFK